MDYIKALSYEGDVINSDVKVEHNVDTSKQGIYEVKYTVIHNEIEVEKTVEVKL